ncbi:MAG: bifunctional phosphopantothenoylcysteine decarboxylase/phosphopantothenate--cysteine ligase CoaBC [Cardiobacteriaceae bacterium]|nr:bifunctional phosphopantothenoylcysteine decarboxylase/phosphopantothenate--cysteine ligase CoaBC [Cardiobacteriaceae bacterium]
MSSKKILLGIGGSIAAYKSANLVRIFKKQGISVRCVLTKSAEEFITAQTLQALSGEPVRRNLFDQQAEAAMSHIELARWADCLIIAPTTANLAAKFASGIADDLISTLYLAANDIPVILAPAMNSKMLLHPATQENFRKLKERGHYILESQSGELACGENAIGRMQEPEKIAQKVFEILGISKPLNPPSPKPLTVTITVGATRENIDPVRFISNRSSGKMGFALAEAALKRGLKVNLIKAYCEQVPPENCQIFPSETAEKMLDAALNIAKDTDIFIATAAVADYRPKQVLSQKHKKERDGALHLELIENPDIVATIAKLPADKRPKLVVGFAAETENLKNYAREKLAKKNLDFICANDVSQFPFGGELNEIAVISKNDERTFNAATKIDIAEKIIDYLLSKIN